MPASQRSNKEKKKEERGGGFKGIPSMTLRQGIHTPALLDREPPRAITALQILEPVHRDAACARGELQQSALLLRIPRLDHVPEIAYHGVGLRVAPVVGVFLPVVDVDVRDAADEKLELALVEDVDEVRGYELVETGDEGVELLRDAFLDAPFRH